MQSILEAELDAIDMKIERQLLLIKNGYSRWPAEENLTQLENRRAVILTEMEMIGRHPSLQAKTIIEAAKGGKDA